MSETEGAKYQKVPVILFYPKGKDHLEHQFVNILDQKDSQFEVLKKYLSEKSVAYQNAATTSNLVEVSKVSEYVPKPEEANEKFTSEDL